MIPLIPLLVMLLDLGVAFALIVFILHFILIYFPFFGSSAPFITIRSDVVPAIIKALDLKPDSVMYELGCGDGRIIFSCYDAEPRAKYVGVDRGILPYLWAKLRYSRRGKPKNIEFRKARIQNTDLSPATHVFTYLMTDLMERLDAKFERELRPGTRLVSCDFKLPKKMPSRVIELNPTKYQLCNKLYVYEF